MRSWERFQRNILNLLSERFLKTYTESIKGASRSPGPKSEGDVHKKVDMYYVCAVTMK